VRKISFGAPFYFELQSLTIAAEEKVNMATFGAIIDYMIVIASIGVDYLYLYFCCNIRG
jgi:hypothetical protein